MGRGDSDTAADILPQLSRQQQRLIQNVVDKVHQPGFLPDYAEVDLCQGSLGEFYDQAQQQDDQLLPIEPEPEQRDKLMMQLIVKAPKKDVAADYGVSKEHAPQAMNSLLYSAIESDLHRYVWSDYHQHDNYGDDPLVELVTKEETKRTITMSMVFDPLNPYR